MGYAYNQLKKLVSICLKSDLILNLVDRNFFTNVIAERTTPMISNDTERYNTFHKLNSSSLQNDTEKYNDNLLSILTTKERIVARIRNSIIILLCLSIIILVLYLASYRNFGDCLRRFIMWMEWQRWKGNWQKYVLWYLKSIQLYTITNRYEKSLKTQLKQI